MTEHIEVIARAVIKVGEQLLVCQSQGTDWYFLPGGHVDFGEPTSQAVQREIQEELGVSATIGPFLGAIENIYDRDGHVNHEVNLVFVAKIQDTEFTSQEDHLTFRLIPISQLSETNLKPATLKQALLTYFTNNQPFGL